MNMTIPKRAIEKAIEGGWNGHISWMKNPERIALDANFWQALGKSCGWIPDYALEAGWGHHAHMFYRLILTNGDTAAFWSELGL